jgi:hypothetical protein
MELDDDVRDAMAVEIPAAEVQLVVGLDPRDREAVVEATGGDVSETSSPVSMAEPMGEPVRVSATVASVVVRSPRVHATNARSRLNAIRGSAAAAVAGAIGFALLSVSASSSTATITPRSVSTAASHPPSRRASAIGWMP